MTNSTTADDLDRLGLVASSEGVPRLLVSVRDANEALAALAGGADVIDIKEPAKGTLGAANTATIRSVGQAVAGRAPVTAAFGELAKLHSPAEAVSGISAAKTGLAGLATADWRARFDAARTDFMPTTRLVPVVYADNKGAESPPAEEVFSFAADRGLGWVVLDTWDKSSGSLLDSLSIDELSRLLTNAGAAGVRVVVAGSLRRDLFAAVVPLGPTLIGVRGAACVGGRLGPIQTARVKQLVRLLNGCLSER